MSRRILIIQGHPDPEGGHYGHALAGAYAKGAREAGHSVESVEVARLNFPVLRTAREFEEGQPVEDIRAGQAAIVRADHLVILFPLWMGGMPALLKAWFEQVFRPGFAADAGEAGRMWTKRLTGKSARIIVTMGMPAFVYRWLYRAHSVKSLKRNILHFSGIKPVRCSYIGMIEASKGRAREQWLRRMERLGRQAR